MSAFTGVWTKLDSNLLMTEGFKTLMEEITADGMEINEIRIRSGA